MKMHRPNHTKTRPNETGRTTTAREQPTPGDARQRRAYTDFLSLCLYPGMPRRAETVLPGVRESAA